MGYKWRKTYGDGFITDDYVLWVDGKPTDYVISPISGCYTAFEGNEEIGIYDSVKDAKAEILAIVNK